MTLEHRMWTQMPGEGRQEVQLMTFYSGSRHTRNGQRQKNIREKWMNYRPDVQSKLTRWEQWVGRTLGTWKELKGCRKNTRNRTGLKREMQCRCEGGIRLVRSTKTQNGNRTQGTGERHHNKTGKHIKQIKWNWYDSCMYFRRMNALNKYKDWMKLFVKTQKTKW